MQFDFEATVSETLACMSEITIDLGSGSCSLREVAAETRCEFPVVPDRLVGAPCLRSHRSVSHEEGTARQQVRWALHYYIPRL